MSILKSKNYKLPKIQHSKRLAVFGDSVSVDWVILICVLFAVLGLGIGFALNSYFYIHSKSFTSDQTEVKDVSLKIDTKQLDRVVEVINRKKEKFDNF